MTPTTPLTDHQKRLLAGSKSYFFEACLADFEFLVSAGFRWFIEDVGRNCYLVSFKKESASNAFTVRIYLEDDDLLWCDLVCVSNDELRVRLTDILGVVAPSERLPNGPVTEAVQSRVRELAEILRARWTEFHAHMLSSLRAKKKEPNQIITAQRASRVAD